MANVSIHDQVIAAGTVLGNTAVVRSCDVAPVYELDPAAGNAGTLSTRTDNTTGTLTLGASHTIETGDTVDIHWQSGGVNYCQRDCTVGTVSGTSVPFSGGSGTNLPAEDSSVVCTEQEAHVVTCDASGLQVFSTIVKEATESHSEGVMIRFLDSGGSEVYTLLTKRNDLEKADVAGGDTNPFSSTDIASITVSNGSGTLAVDLYILLAQNV